MMALALTLLVSWICLKALSMPSHEQQQAALLPFAEEPQPKDPERVSTLIA